MIVENHLNNLKISSIDVAILSNYRDNYNIAKTKANQSTGFGPKAAQPCFTYFYVQSLSNFNSIVI